MFANNSRIVKYREVSDRIDREGIAARKQCPRDGVSARRAPRLLRDHRADRADRADQKQLRFVVLGCFATGDRVGPNAAGHHSEAGEIRRFSEQSSSLRVSRRCCGIQGEEAGSGRRLGLLPRVATCLTCGVGPSTWTESSHD